MSQQLGRQRAWYALCSGMSVGSPLTYVLPLRSEQFAATELVDYVRRLAREHEVLVIDGSPPDVFAVNHARCGPDVRHLSPDADLHFVNGKVVGVLTGLRHASHETVVVADDDVRYEEADLASLAVALGDADVVLPQNYFDPLPWHAWLDTGRSLINRVSGGDWPGTLAVRRSTLARTDGYDGDVMFENLELVRTVQAAGGRLVRAPDIYVRRLPPTARHFWSQRVRQAYDELARPIRLAVWLAVLPACIAAVVVRRPVWIAIAATAALVAAEAGRRRAGGTRVFPASTSLAAPVWVAERAVCAWVAVLMRLVRGGVTYRGRTIRRAATPLRVLRRRFAGAAA